MMNLRVLPVLLGLLLLSLASFAAEPLDLNNAAWSLKISNGLEGTKELSIDVTTRFGLFATSVAQKDIQLVPSVPKIDDKGIKGDLTINIKKVLSTFTLDVTVKDGVVDGKYTGTADQTPITGTVTGTVKALPADSKLELVRASFLGTEGNDDLQGAAVGPDGSIYLVGNTAEPRETAPDGAKLLTLGTPAAEPHCGSGFVAKLTPDASKVLAYTQFAKGITILTTALVNKNGVYISGYASDALEPILKAKTGLTTAYPLTEEMRLIKEGKIFWANGGAEGSADSIAKNPGLGRYGAPCVLKLPADLSAIDNGTYLEGWQQVYGKFRVFTKPFKTGFQEYTWQPTSLVQTQKGDIIVCHDGGYFRVLTDKDRAFAATTKKPEKMLHDLGFYDVPDWLSSLSPDLTTRNWRTPIYTPEVDQKDAETIYNGWQLDHYGSPRTSGLSIDSKDQVYLDGWSAGMTISEPWWTPYLWKVDGATGKRVWKAYDWSPISGTDHRLNGNVADTALGACAVEDDGNVLVSLYSDGGNNMMGRGPRGPEGIGITGPKTGGGYAGGLVHFNGQVQRVDANTRDGLASSGNGHSSWVVGIDPLKDGYFIGVGRWNVMGGWSKDAWFTSGATENPNAFLRLYGPKFSVEYTTAIPGIVPFASARLSPTSYIIVGRAENPVVPTKGALQSASAGKNDGYFMVVNMKEPEKGL